MLASQLLRILQTLPSDVKQEDMMRMKGNHRGAVVYGREEGRDFPTFLDLNDGDSSWNPFLAEFSPDGQKGSRISGSPNGFPDEPPVVEKDEHEVQNGPGGFEDLDSDCDKKVVDDSVVHILKDIRVVDDDGYVKDRVFIQSDGKQTVVSDQVVGDDGELSDEGCSKTDPGSREGSKADPIQERGTRSLLGSFLGSLDNEETKVVPQNHPTQVRVAHTGFISLLEIEDRFAPQISAENVVEEGLHDEENSDVKKDKNDVGESSFSRESLVSYSGPVTHGGSISMRSDGSATSGRSFAFPILHAEWNSSPVRMAKAEGRHFRRFKGWKSGVFCCRF